MSGLICECNVTTSLGNIYAYTYNNPSRGSTTNAKWWPITKTSYPKIWCSSLPSREFEMRQICLPREYFHRLYWSRSRGKSNRRQMCWYKWVLMIFESSVLQVYYKPWSPPWSPAANCCSLSPRWKNPGGLTHICTALLQPIQYPY